MEKDNEMHYNDVDKNRAMKNPWVDERLAKLNPGGDWQPDVNSALARFNRQRAPGRARKWTLAAAVVTAVCVLMLAFPEQRAQAERACLGACESLFNTKLDGEGLSFHGLHHLVAPLHSWMRNVLGVAKAHTDKTETVPGAARDFAAKDSTGANIRLSDYRGKVVLLNFWATWCRPCQTEIPWFVEFERAHQDQGFAVIGISMDGDGWKAVRPYMDAKKINYRVAVDGGTIAQAYGGVESLPETFLIDREGRIASRHVGLVSKSVYENEILQLLEK